MNTDTYDVAIIGGGAAGLSAALVLGRARRRVAVIDAGAPRNAPAAHMQGFISRDGTPPTVLLAAAREEVLSYGVDVVDDRVAAARPGFDLQLESRRTVRARRLLLASGAIDEIPDLPGARERWGRDVLHCPYCHGWEVADQPIGVLSTGPASIEHAHLLRQWSDDVILFAHTTDISPPQRHLLALRGITVVSEPVARLQVDHDRLTAVQLADGSSIARSALFVRPALRAHGDGIAVALGCQTTPEGLVVTQAEGRTTAPGVWAAGNATNPRAQVITAAGEGSAAAIAINNDLVRDDIARATRGAPTATA